MTDDLAIPRFPSTRLLRLAAVGTLIVLFVLLVLGAVVTSFRVGMADPVWPTRPWHLLTISYEEPSSGYLIEHTHRLAGFTAGLAVTLLAMLAWMTEPRRFLRWVGLAALLALVGLFMGHLHGSLIAKQNAFQATGELTLPDWTSVAGPTLVALAVTAVLTIWSAVTGAGAKGAIRLLGVALLVAVMVQGVLGGLRVYLNALCGTDLAAIHGVFSQIVLALAVTFVVATGPRRDSLAVADRGLNRWALIAAVIVFGQIIAGALLRHTDSPLGPRLHLFGAFLVVFATAAVSRRSRGTRVRGLAVLAASLAGLQILIGVEAWMIRFKAGFALSAIQQVTKADAIVRTLHAVVGYGLFATVVAVAAALVRDRAPAIRKPVVLRPQVPEEAVA
jgi:heme A synthase